MADKSEPPPGAGAHGAPPTVLLVEDETMMALTLRDYLEEMGCEVVGYATTAIDAARLAAATLPDVVIMDILMDGRPQGITAAELIRLQRNVPVVFITGAVDADILDQAGSFPASEILFKPFTVDTLHEVIRRACGKP